ncbi:hypothetical protein JCM18905_3564 [Vibrio sp. JCM 18905]|nr:hypothetical protein JCM18905_3564 [Vibrio sp. JCM 18905]
MFVGALSGCLIGQGSVHTCFGLVAFGSRAGSYLVVWFRKMVLIISSFSSKSVTCGKT